MSGYQKLSVLLREELQQLKEEGKNLDFDQFIKEIDEAGEEKSILMEIYKNMSSLSVSSDFKYDEPTDYEEILLKIPGSLGKVNLPNDEKLYDKMYGAWLGRCIGCALGQPVELWNYDGIKTWCEKADAWPLDFYIPTHSRAEQEDNFKLNLLFSTSDNIRYMPTDDDIRYTVLGLMMMKVRSLNWDTWDLGSFWLYKLPFRMLCTAENQAYLNFANIDANNPWSKPQCADELIKGTNTYLNPYREWIGAQIRIDAYGYVAAGDPHLAAKLAHTDAIFSHVKNGVYGAMFFAAMISAAFGEENLDKVIERAFAEIPRNTRFYDGMIKAVDIAKSAQSIDDLIININKEFKQYSPVHTINNAALCLASIVYARGDFNKAVTLSVMGGWDTDCNGATVGSVMGAYVGEKNIPSKWKEPLNDLLYSEIPGYHPIKISEVARQTLETHKNVFK